MVQVSRQQLKRGRKPRGVLGGEEGKEGGGGG